GEYEFVSSMVRDHLVRIRSRRQEKLSMPRSDTVTQVFPAVPACDVRFLGKRPRRLSAFPDNMPSPSWRSANGPDKVRTPMRCRSQTRRRRTRIRTGVGRGFMSGELFRREALEARKVRWLGGISLAQPLRPWLLTAFAVLAAALVLLFLLRGEYTRRTRVVGQLVPEQGMATVVSPATGVLARVDVPEGGRVAAGQILAVVRVPHATLAAGDTLAALEKRLGSRARALADAHAARLQLLDAQAAGL